MEFLFTGQGKRIGRAVAQRVFDLDGYLVGQLDGSHVHNVAGDYIGELEDGVIRDKGFIPLAICRCNPTSIGISNPGSRVRRQSAYPDISLTLFRSKWAGHCESFWMSSD